MKKVQQSIQLLNNKMLKCSTTNAKAICTAGSNS